MSSTEKKWKLWQFFAISYLLPPRSFFFLSPDCMIEVVLSISPVSSVVRQWCWTKFFREGNFFKNCIIFRFTAIAKFYRQTSDDDKFKILCSHSWIFFRKWMNLPEARAEPAASAQSRNRHLISIVSHSMLCFCHSTCGGKEIRLIVEVFLSSRRKAIMSPS